MKSSTNSTFQAELKEILGISVTQETQYSQCGPYIAYTVGSNIVILDLQNNQQIQFISHNCNSISSIAATKDGKKIAVAQSIKGSPITIYDLTETENVLKPKYIIKGHKYGASMIEWSPNGKYLVSVSNEDGGMFVWEGGSRISQNKMGRKINKIVFSDDGNLITAGKQHFKIWQFENGNIIRTQINDCWMMEGKGILMGKTFMDKQFINIACKNGRFVALSSDGILCIIKNGTIDQMVDTKLTQPKGLDIFEKWAICGGENATIKVIDIDTLQLVSVFSRPSIVSQQNPTLSDQIQESGTYNDCIGIKVCNQYIVSLYMNQTIFIWEITDSIIKAHRCILGHSEEIISLKLLQQIQNQICFFATSGKDGSLRIWHTYGECYDNKKIIDIAEAIGVKRNTYCKYLTEIIYSKHVIEFITSTNLLLVGASSKIIYVYSLSNFSLLYELPIQNCSIDAIETYNNQLYIGLSNNTIKIFSISETMLKATKIIATKHKVEEIRLAGRNMVVFTKGSFMIVQLDTDYVFKEQKDVDAADLVDGKLLYYLRKNKLHMYNIQKKKEKQSITLQLEISLKYKVRVITNLIIVLSNLQNSSILQVWSHEGFLIYNKNYNELIQDILLCSDGNCILATKNGCILVEEFSYRSVFTKIQRQFKRWFQENDLSWTAGSVWISQELKNKNFNNPDDLLSSISQPPINKIPDKILTQSLAMSSKGEPITNVNIAYRKNDQKVSIFNPSHISDQVNKVISNVNNIQKKFEVKSPRNMDTKIKTINLDDPFQDIKLSGQSRLVQSVINNIQPRMNNFVAKSQDFQREEMLLSQKVPRQTQQDSGCVDVLYEIMTGDEQTKNRFASLHSNKLKKIHEQLNYFFGTQNNVQVAREIQSLSASYLESLRSLITKL